MCLRARARARTSISSSCVLGEKNAEQEMVENRKNKMVSSLLLLTHV